MSQQQDLPGHGRRDWRDFVPFAAAIAQILVVWHPAIPLGIPAEWTWERIPVGPVEIGQLLANLIFVLPLAALYYWFCCLGEQRIGQARAGAWLGGLTLAGFGWLWTVQQAVPDELHSLGRGPIVLNFPAFSGYFTEAHAIEDLPGYLSRYESQMAEGDVLHIGTHPPGLIVGHYCLLKVFKGSEALTALALATRPESVRSTEEMIAFLPSLRGPPTDDADLAELWVAALLIQFAAALCVVPIFQITKQSSDHRTAWRTVCLWPLVPAIGIFLPKSDILVAYFGLVTIALWWPARDRRWRAVAAGGMFWIGMMTSLAMLPVGLLCGALSLYSLMRLEHANRPREFRNIAVRTGLAGATFLSLTAAVWIFFDLNMPRVWSWNYMNHSAFYDAYERTYWIWLLLNPLELALAIGLPIVASVIVRWREVPIGAASTLPVVGVVLLLWISGKNSGEAARLWIFLMPWLMWLSSALWRAGTPDVRWRRILLLLLVVSWAVVVRVSGFSFLQVAGIAD